MTSLPPKNCATHVGLAGSGNKALPRSDADNALQKKVQPENLEAAFAAALAEAVVQEHAPGTLSLVVCNTVRFAQTLFEIIAQRRAQSGDAILLTSRFRPMDRKFNADRLIAFEKARKAGEPHSGTRSA